MQAVGANYSDEWGEKAKITASYFFNRAGNRNESLTDRQTFTSSEKLVLYDGATDARIENVNHRFNSRFDYKFNNRHSLMMRTAFSVQDYLLDNETFSRTDNKFADDDIRFVNRRRNFAHNDNFGYNVSNNLIYRYRLPGSKLRSLTFGVGGRYSGGSSSACRGSIPSAIRTTPGPIRLLTTPAIFRVRTANSPAITSAEARPTPMRSAGVRA